MDENGSDKKEHSLAISPKSDEGLAFFNSYMPPVEVHTVDGEVLLVPFAELDEKLATLRQTYKERRKHGNGRDS